MNQLLSPLATWIRRADAAVEVTGDTTWIRVPAPVARGVNVIRVRTHRYSELYIEFGKIFVDRTGAQRYAQLGGAIIDEARLATVVEDICSSASVSDAALKPSG